MIKIVADNFVKPDSKAAFLEITEKLIEGTRSGRERYYLQSKN